MIEVLVHWCVAVWLGGWRKMAEDNQAMIWILLTIVAMVIISQLVMGGGKGTKKSQINENDKNMAKPTQGVLVTFRGNLTK